MGDDELGRVASRHRRRADLLVGLVAVAVVVAALLVALALDARSWAVVAVLGVVALLVTAAVALVGRMGRAGPATAPRRSVDSPPAEPERAPTEIDLDARTGGDEVIDLDAEEGGVTRVPLHPDPIWRRRLADRPDLLWIQATPVGLDVPGWLLHRRPRTIDPRDVVTIPWTAIGRFRVRADRDGPDTYDITGRGAGDRPERWRIRRQEIREEVALLDHVRTVGRITIELEDSIRS